MYTTVSCSELPTTGTWTCWSESSQGTGSKWTETSALIGEGERAGAGQPGGKKAQGSLIHVYKCPTAGFSKCYSVTGEKAGGTD